MLRKCIYLILLTFLSYFKTLAQENSNKFDTLNSSYDYKNLNHRLGFTSSMMSAYGLSYEYFLSREFVLEFNAFIFGESSSEDDFYAPYFVSAFGTELQYNLHQNSKSRFYLLAAASLWHSSYKKRYNWEDSKFDEFEDIENFYISSLAIGLEYNLSKTIVANLEGGFSYRRQQFFANEIEWSTSENKYLARAYKRNSYIYGLGFGIGVYYSF